MNKEQRLSNFLTKAQQLHGDRYDYIHINDHFVNAKTPIPISCRLHGMFLQTPDQHIRTYNTAKHANTGGCPTCAQQSRIETKRKSVDQFITEATMIHDGKYTYANVNYVNTHTKVRVTCDEHGDFLITPKDHLTGKQGCRQCCYRKHHSGKAVRWLESIERERGILLQRVGNGKEFKIPHTRFHADGYDPHTNTIYEFYGDRFHGNPAKYKRDVCCHPFDKNITAGELYDATISRENLLKELGYTVVTMWESSFTEPSS